MMQDEESCRHMGITMNTRSIYRMNTRIVPNGMSKESFIIGTQDILNMPRGSPRQSLGTQIHSTKNSVSNLDGSAAGTKTTRDIAVAVDAAALLSADQVTRGCKIHKIWIEFWVYASEEITVATTNSFDAYLIKNQGNNLTPPTPGTQGTSNEKRFIFKTWKGLIGARTHGCYPYNFRGWVKIPKVYQRMGADDQLEMVFISTGTNSIVCSQFIYKWYT